MEDGTLHSTIRRSLLLAFALAACATALAAPVAAEAGPTNYVALGDSYTSSPLTGAVATGVPASCLQSTNDYPHVVAAALRAASFTDVSCSGAVIANLTQPQTNIDGLGTNPSQLDALSPSTTLVTIGIGANDANVFGVADECVVVDLLQPTGSACEDRYTVEGVEKISQLIDQTAPELAAAYQSVHARAPQARELAVGYPAIVPVDGTSCWPLLSVSPDDVSFLASLLVHVDKMIATTAAANGVQYVDTYTPTIGHDVCQPIGAAGFTALLPTSGLSLLMHPDALGEELMAEAVLGAIANPPATPRSTVASAHLKLTHAAIGRVSVTARGTISRLYRGRVAVTFRYHGRAIDLHRAARVTDGRFRAELPLPHHYRRVLHTGTFTVTSQAETGLAAGTARARIEVPKAVPMRLASRG